MFRNWLLPTRANSATMTGAMRSAQTSRGARSGMALAGVGVVLFSATFPATTVALRGFDAVFIGAGRPLGAALLAGATLRITRSPRPTRRQVEMLLACVPGVGIGYGVLTAIALEHVTASHAAVVTGLLPAATAAVATWRAGERPGRLFWAASLAGACTVVAFALSSNAGGVHAADLLLLLALILGAVGYAEGGRLAREMPGWRVICWVVVLALPISLPLTVVAGIISPPHPAIASAGALLYVASVTMFLGFFAWYSGLARAGIARASQLQLAQPFLTIGIAAVVLGERPGTSTYVAGAVVFACVLVAQRARFLRGRARLPSPHSLEPAAATRNGR
jgi:drug/metabolite transporter (DMT)-like permease